MSGTRGGRRLGGLALLDESIVPQFAEDVLDDFCLLRRWGSAKDVKFDFEPVVDAFVDGMVFGTQSFRIYAFLQCLCFGRSAILVLVILVT
jgi:hypothetical protein